MAKKAVAKSAETPTVAETKAPEKAPTKAKGAWLIATPNPKYSGVTGGIHFRNGHAIVRGEQDPKPMKVIELQADFGYVAKFYTQDQIDEILAKDEAMQAEDDMNMAEKLSLPAKM